MTVVPLAPTSSDCFEISLFSTWTKFLIPLLLSQDDILVFEIEQILDKASPLNPFDFRANKSSNEFWLELAKDQSSWSELEADYVNFALGRLDEQ